MGDKSDISQEPLLNRASENDGVKKNLRIQNALQPLEGYQTSDTDTNPGGTSYYGFLRKDGAWYIMKGVESGSVTVYTYKAGDLGYDFSTRTGGTYAAFDTTFG